MLIDIKLETVMICVALLERRRKKKVSVDLVESDDLRFFKDHVIFEGDKSSIESEISLHKTVHLLNTRD